MPLAWGHTCLLETDWRLITQESPGFIHGECQPEIYFPETHIRDNY